MDKDFSELLEALHNQRSYLADVRVAIDAMQRGIPFEELSDGMKLAMNLFLGSLRTDTMHTVEYDENSICWLVEHESKKRVPLEHGIVVELKIVTDYEW